MILQGLYKKPYILPFHYLIILPVLSQYNHIDNFFTNVLVHRFIGAPHHTGRFLLRHALHPPVVPFPDSDGKNEQSHRGKADEGACGKTRGGVTEFDFVGAFCQGDA